MYFYIYRFGSEHVLFWAGLKRPATDKCTEKWTWPDFTDYNEDVFQAWKRGDPGCKHDLMVVGYSPRTGWGSWLGTRTRFGFLYHCLCERNATVLTLYRFAKISPAASADTVHVTFFNLMLGLGLLLLLSLGS